MNSKNIYLGLTIIGVVLSFSLLLPWLIHHGVDLDLLFEGMFGNPIALIFVTDVFLSAVVFVQLMRTDGRNLSRSRKIFLIVGLCTVGVCLALPLFLYMKELEKQSA